MNIIIAKIEPAAKIETAAKIESAAKIEPFSSNNSKKNI